MSQPDIIVVDDAGEPIAGARIIGTSMSIGGQSTKTNKRGEASIPWAIQPTIALSVEKDGYTSQNNISTSAERPIRVILQPSP